MFRLADLFLDLHSPDMSCLLGMKMRIATVGLFSLLGPT